MTSLLAQLAALLLAGFALFRFWRANRSSDRWINIVIATGFLGRAVAGQILFWISYARLPIARGLQMGNGLWFFASDALLYFPTATGLANSGVRAIIDYPAGGPSVAYVKVLAASVLLLGGVTSVAVLLNLFCYLGTMAVIVRWSEGEPRARLAATFAVCAVSLSPAFFLWTLQPLKDTFFQFVVIAFIGGCAAWQRAWIALRPRIPALLIIACTTIITMLAISGLRWYFAFALFIAAIAFLLTIASMSRGRKAAAFAATAVLIVLLSRAFLLGGGPYVPTPIIRVMTPSTAIAAVRQLPSQMIINIEMARDDFAKAGGGTSIHAGGSMSKLDHALRASAAVAEPPRPRLAASPTPPLAASPAPPLAASPAPPLAASPTPPLAASPAPPLAASPAPPLAASPAPQIARLPPAQAVPRLSAQGVVPRHSAAAVVPQHSATVVKQASRATRVLIGVASVFIPRSVGERLRLFHIGGGRGMFWFADLDTVIFDLIFLGALVALATRLSVSLRNPMVWFLFLLTLLIGVPLAYVITNYGTLFRLREMIYITLAVTPLALATSSRRHDAMVAPDVPAAP